MLCWLPLLLWAGPSGGAVAVLPRAGNPENSVAFYEIVSLKPISRIADVGGADILQILPLPDGSKSFLISRSGNTPVIALDENYANPHPLGAKLGVAPSAAILTPDGTRLAVAAGSTLHFFDTATEAAVLPDGLTMPGNLIDVAVTFDSRTLFALAQSADGKIQLSQVINDRIANTLTLPGDRNAPPTSLLLAPNGRLYLFTNLRIYEIDTRTNQVTRGGEIRILGYAGKGAAATPDGRYIFVPNASPLQGATPLYQLDTRNRTAFPAAALPGQEAFELFRPSRSIIGTEGMIGLTRGGRLFDIRLGPSITTSFADAYFAEGTNVRPSYASVSLSNEFFPRKLAVIKTEGDKAALFSVDLVDQRLAHIELPNAPWRTALVTPSAPAGTTLRMLQINASQVVAASARSPLPLVVRCVEPEGKGVFRAPVTFTTSAPGVTIENSIVLAGADGYAQTYVTAGDAAGPFTVTATTPGAPPLTFTLEVPATPNGADLSGLNIVSGNGLVVRELSRSSAFMTVQLRDLNGVPQAGQPVRWTVKEGLGAISSASTLTDGAGMARAQFNSGVVTTSESYTQALIEASTPNHRATFFATTTPAAIPSRGLAPDPVVTILYPDFEQTRTFQGPAGGVLKNAIGIRITNAVGPDTGLGLPNVGLRGSVSEGAVSAECNTEALTDVTGFLSCDLRLGPTTGTGTLQFNAGEFRDLPTAKLVVTLGGPARVLIVTGNNQSAPINQALPTPLTARVTDAGGNVLNNIPVQWTVSRGTATLASATSVTDSNGNTSIRASLGGTPGAVTIRAAVNSEVFANFTQTATVVYGNLRIVGGDDQSALTNAPFAEPLAVEVRDNGGAAVPGVPVTFTTTEGDALLSAATALTDANGIARVNATAAPAAGLSTIEASIDRFRVSFALRTRPRAPIVSTVRNAFSNELEGLAPCGLAAITGSFLTAGVGGTITAPAGLALLPASLGPIESITINNVPAGLVSVTNFSGVERVVFQTPCETSGPATLTVKVAGLNATTVSAIPVVAYQPAISAPATAARRGSSIVLEVTGLGQTQPQPIVTSVLGTGSGQTVSAPLTAGVNDQGVRILKAEYGLGLAGVYLVEVEIPADMAVGPAQPVVIAVTTPSGETLYSPTVFLAVN